MVNKRGIILYKTKHVKEEDTIMRYSKELLHLYRPGVEANADRAYKGIEKDFPHLKVKIPEKKKKRGGIKQT